MCAPWAMAEEATPPDGRPAREPLFAEHLDVARAAQLRERWEVESSEGQQRDGQIHHEQDRPRSRKSRSGAMAEGPPPEAHENE